MKKLLYYLLAMLMILSLSACQSDSSLLDESQGGQGSNEESSSGDMSLSNGMTNDYSESDSSQPLAVVYASKDVLVFELNDPSAKEVYDNAIDNFSDSAYIEFSLTSFDATILIGENSDNATISFQGYNESASTNVGELEFRIRWSLDEDTLQIACLNHGYDISTLEGARIDIRVSYNYDSTLITGGNLSSTGDTNFLLSYDVPEEYSSPVTVNNDYSPSDFPGFEYASMITDDYFLSYGFHNDLLQITYFDETGNAVFIEDITYYGTDSTWFNGWTSTNEQGYECGTTLVGEYQKSYGIYDVSSSSKYTFFYYWLGMAGYESLYDQTQYHYYFSKPELHAYQMFK
ncbi:MAG: hypothetical protein R3Y57_06125 [Erysipelotrichaceae bacterium]